jgi:hypothetical protein
VKKEVSRSCCSTGWGVPGGRVVAVTIARTVAAAARSCRRQGSLERLAGLAPHRLAHGMRHVPVMGLGGGGCGGS